MVLKDFIHAPGASRRVTVSAQTRRVPVIDTFRRSFSIFQYFSTKGAGMPAGPLPLQNHLMPPQFKALDRTRTYIH